MLKNFFLLFIYTSLSASGPNGLGFIFIELGISVASVGTTYATSQDYFDASKRDYEVAQTFIDDNKDSLAIDIAQGEGEYLDSLITILRIKDREEFRISLQNNFEVLYFHDEIDSKELLDQILLI